jgi:predicted N-acetyltransferase YhbS
MPEIVIRPETPSDVDAVSEINVAAFLDHPYSHQTEHLIVDALRASDALDVSLVALRDGRPVGHIAFSKAVVGLSDGWFLLGPVAVLPDLQGHGVGSALVTAGLEELRSRGGTRLRPRGRPGVLPAVWFPQCVRSDVRRRSRRERPLSPVRHGRAQGIDSRARRILGRGRRRRQARLTSASS